MRERRSTWSAAFAAVNIALVIAMFSVHGYRALIWGVIGGLSAAAVLTGVVKRRPARLIPWLAAALAALAIVARQIAATSGVAIRHHTAVPPSHLVDTLSVASWLLVSCSVLGFVVIRSREHQVGALLDALAVTSAAALLAWLHLIQPYLRAHHGTVSQQVTFLQSPIGALIVLLLLARMLFGTARTNAALLLATLGTMGFLVSDTLAMWAQVHNTSRFGTAADLGWAAFSVCWGAAALHPSMQELTDVQSTHRWQLGVAALTVVGLMALTPAWLVYWSASSGTGRSGRVLGAFVATQVLIFVARLAGVARSQRLLARREHALRDLGSSLAGATELHDLLRAAIYSVRTIAGAAGSACLVTTADASADTVIAGYPARLEGLQLVASEPSIHGRAVSVERVGGQSLPGVPATARWISIPLPNAGDNTRRMLLAHTRRLPQDAVDILQEVAAQVTSVAMSLAATAERNRLEYELRHRAFHDSLTDLANRELFNDRVQTALNRIDRQHTSVAVLLLDVDDFKLVNDTLGHMAGDELLVEVGARLQRCLRSGDTAARLGGDEFAVCTEFVSTDPADNIRILAARIVGVFRTPFKIADTQVPVGVSVGVSVSYREKRRASDMLREADLALYESKNAGKNRFSFYEPRLQKVMVDRIEQRSALEEAVVEGQLCLYYQPIVRLRDRQVVGAEALVRWNHPTRGLVSPGDFIPLAEESGLVVPLGNWVLERACAELARWSGVAADGPLKMSVNVAAAQLSSGDFIRVVDQALSRHGVDPAALTLEITESVLVEDDQNTADCLWALDKRGIRIALDDFGTGYSSLGYLQRFPFRFIKIDQSFVAAMDSTGHALVDSIVSLGRSLKLEIIAEGVESEAQAEELARLRCDFGQGYLFGRPMPAYELFSKLGHAAGDTSEISDTEARHHRVGKRAGDPDQLVAAGAAPSVD